jgi:PmbA protein
MKQDPDGGEIAYRVADRLKTASPWEVYAERSERYEVHFNGTATELIHGPIALAGFGVRVFRPRNGKTSTGFQASTDLTDAGIRAALEDAEGLARYTEFPAKSVELPSTGPTPEGGPKVVDPELWKQPLGAVEGHISALFDAFHGRQHAVPSFGSVRATLTQTSIANSAGLRTTYPQTTVEFEVAVKAFGGPEGPAPGEYWVTESGRRLDKMALPRAVERWCQYAADVRRATPPPTGALAVILPAGVLSGILPTTLGFKLSGAARLRKISVPPGQKVAPENVTIRDDGCYDWSLSSAPCDDEGSPQRLRTLVSKGSVQELVYDSLYGAAFDVPTTANAVRSAFGGTLAWKRFTRPPSPAASTMVVAPGNGGTDLELVETAKDGIWVQQLGWANPDPISGAFGGEIRIGYRIRGGKLAEPIRGGIVGGLVLGPPGAPSLLGGIESVGGTLDLSESVASPSILVRPLSVAGGPA